MFDSEQFVGKAFPVVKPHIKSIIETVDPLYVSFYKELHKINRPIPPMKLRVRISGNRWIDEFMQVGHKCVNNLDKAVISFSGKRLADYEKILDFGCGCGRVMQYLFWNDLFKDVKLYGCDVDASAVNWMQNNYSKDSFVVNSFEPPMPFEDNFFDLVYAYSVFTHLDEDMQFVWLKDIKRVLKPGGIALLTIHGKSALHELTNSSNISRSLAERLKMHKLNSERNFIFEPYEDLASNSGKYPGIGSVYGLSFHSHSYIKDCWSNLFEIQGIYSNKEDSFQEVVVLKKYYTNILSSVLSLDASFY